MSRIFVDDTIFQASSGGHFICITILFYYNREKHSSRIILFWLEVDATAKALLCQSCCGSTHKVQPQGPPTRSTHKVHPHPHWVHSGCRDPCILSPCWISAQLITILGSLFKRSKGFEHF